MFTAEEQIAELGYFGQTELEFLPVLRGGKKLFEKAEVAILNFNHGVLYAAVWS